MEGWFDEATVVAQFTPIRPDMIYLPAQLSATRRGHPVRDRDVRRWRGQLVTRGHMTEGGEE